MVKEPKELVKKFMNALPIRPVGQCIRRFASPNFHQAPDITSQTLEHFTYALVSTSKRKDITSWRRPEMCVFGAEEVEERKRQAAKWHKISQ